MIWLTYPPGRCMTWMFLQTWFPDDLWTQNLEQSIVRGDPTSNVLYFAVLILCAPIWEEVRVSFSHQWCKTGENVEPLSVYVATDCTSETRTLTHAQLYMWP